MSDAAHEIYKPAALLPGLVPLACACCGAAPELFEFIDKPGDDCQKVIMCSTAEGLGPEFGLVDDGCPLYMPPMAFYRPTQREAVQHWNLYTKALMQLQRRNRWTGATVLREALQDDGEPSA